MIPAVVCVAVMLIAVCRRIWGKQPPLDGDEIRLLRRLADRIRSDQILPYE
jgi:hypothetical protein